MTDPADSRRKRIIVVVAVARNGVIGDGLRMPWRLPSDLRRFRRLTMGNAIVMGRRTFESIGKPLDGRLNIVVSRSNPEVPEGVRVAKNLDAAVALAEAAPGIADVMIIGGGELYRAAIGRADLLYVTHVAAEPAGDITFPPIDPAIWKATRRESPAADPKDTAATEFVMYERVTPL